MKKWYFIYTLAENGKIFYVGVTDHINRRFLQHITKYGAAISMNKIDDCFCELESALKLENDWIKKLVSEGANLINKGISTEPGGCKRCGKSIEQYIGRRKRVFCSDNCRATFWQKNNKKKKTAAVINKDYSIGKKMDVSKLEFKDNFRALPQTLTKLQEYEAELLRLGDTPLGKKRRKFVEGEIEKLKNNNTASNH